MEYKCPECGGDIYIRRIDDGEVLVKVTPDGDLDELSNRSDGSTAVFCSEKPGVHDIPQDMQDELIDIYWEYY